MITQNEIKYVKSLAQRKFRQKYNKFIVEGDKICNELLSVGSYAIEDIYSTNEWANNHVSSLDSFKEKVTIVSDKELGRISNLKTANNVLMVLKLPNEDIVLDMSNAVIYLDNVQDPGNVGTIIRIADWFGVTNVIRSPGTADFFSPKVVQSTMASFANVVLSTQTIEELKLALPDHRFIGAVLGGKPLRSYQWKKQSVIVMGNESKGVTPHTLSMLDDKVMIEGHQNRLADSLNVGIATSIMCQSWYTQFNP